MHIQFRKKAKRRDEKMVGKKLYRKTGKEKLAHAG